MKNINKKSQKEDILHSPVQNSTRGIVVEEQHGCPDNSREHGSVEPLGCSHAHLIKHKHLHIDHNDGQQCQNPIHLNVPISIKIFIIAITSQYSRLIHTLFNIHPNCHKVIPTTGNNLIQNTDKEHYYHKWPATNGLEIREVDLPGDFANTSMFRFLLGFLLLNLII